jgi:bifunctional non-homologous end joining protein LigD
VGQASEPLGGRQDTTIRVEDRTLRLSNLHKVLYPEVGFTKAEVIDYYARVAPAMLAHVGDRSLTLRRYPNGVEGKSFFEKRCPSHRPEWVRTAPGPGDHNGSIDYCLLADTPSLVWAANMAALELHAPMARAGDMETPTMVVFDLDPGLPAAIVECARVGLLVRDVLDGTGLRCLAKTSGSKGLGQVLERADPGLIVTTQAKAARPGKVLVDWSQNSRHKTTVAAYSLRARPRPTVSAPVTWDEVEAAADGEPLSFEAADVLDRVADLGDLFADAATLEQRLPSSDG